MKFKDFLISINSCREAIDWVGDMDPETAWETSLRGDWMEWIIIECQPEVIAARADYATASAALNTALDAARDIRAARDISARDIVARDIIACAARAARDTASAALNTAYATARAALNTAYATARATARAAYADYAKASADYDKARADYDTARADYATADAALNTALDTARAARAARDTARDTALGTALAAYADAIREVYPTLPETIKAALKAAGR